LGKPKNKVGVRKLEGTAKGKPTKGQLGGLNTVGQEVAK